MLIKGIKGKNESRTNRKRVQKRDKWDYINEAEMKKILRVIYKQLYRNRLIYRVRKPRIIFSYILYIICFFFSISLFISWLRAGA